MLKYEENPPEVGDLKFRKIPDTYFTDEEYDRIVRRGFEVGDQVFTTDRGGSYNASLFKRMMWCAPEHFRMGVGPLDKDLFEYIVKNIEINEQHMRSLTEEQLVEPVSVVTLNDAEPNYIIDGHHRLVRLYLEGYRQCYMAIADRLMTFRCYVAAPRNRGY